METTLEEYQNITSIFYRKIIRIHPKKQQLYEKYRQMVELFNKKKDDRSETLSTRQRKGRLELDDSKSVSNISAKSLTKSYKSIRNIELKSISTEYLFISTKFERTFLYAYYYELIDTENHKTMEMVETNTKLLIETVNRKELSEGSWNKTSLEWKKLKQLLPHKNKVRWEKILGQLITSFPDVFITIMMNGVQKSQQLKAKTSQQKVQKLSHILKLRILYFQCQNGQVINKRTYGEGKSKIRIGYLISDQKYGFFDKLPNESISSQTKETPKQEKKHRLTIGQNQFPTSSLRSLDTRKSERAAEMGKSSQRDLTRRNSVLSQNKSESSRSSLHLGKKKVIRAIENILLDFKNDSLKFQELECIKGENDKEREIKARLNRRRQIQK